MNAQSKITRADPVATALPRATTALTREAVRRFRAGDLTGLEYGDNAIAEAKGRAIAFVDRIIPDITAPNCLADPVGFIAASRRAGDRSALYLRANDRLLWAIIRRDDLLPVYAVEQAA